MAIEISDDLVRRIATLSRLALSSEEKAGLQEHFEKILAYIEAFQALDTRDVDPSHFSIDTVNVYRQDESRPSLPVDQVLACAPRASPPHFLVPRIVADAEGDSGGGREAGGAP